MKVGNINLDISDYCYLSDAQRAVYWFILESMPGSECVGITASLSSHGWLGLMLELSVGKLTVVEAFLADGSIEVRQHADVIFRSYLLKRFDLSGPNALEEIVTYTLQGLRKHARVTCSTPGRKDQTALRSTSA